ncbi:MAG: hypothetical protein AAGF92_01890 [Myxococcota bacterium]
MKKSLISALCIVAATLVTPVASAQLTSLKTFELPERTDWVPSGCRDVEAKSAAQASRATWRNLHSDARSSDEITTAIAPVFETEWTAEPNTYSPTGPVFDNRGNVYFAPLAPAEPVVMISIDPVDGSRRWAIPATTGAVPGFHTPVVLKDPTDSRAEAVFLMLSDRAIAVRPDGSTIWDVEVPFPTNAPIIGIQYHAPTDSLIGVSTDGYLLGIARTSGALTLAPVELPGEATPLPAPTLPPAVFDCIAQKIAPLADLASTGLTVAGFVNLLLGNGIEVANSFSIDPNSGRLWVAATAPDEVDSNPGDGVSEFGALYAFDLVPSGSGYYAHQACRADFSGGTAATPAIKADGTRVYTADNETSVLAFDSQDCSEAWRLDVGEQVFGSIGVSSDNDELYASSRAAVRQLFDRGDHAELGWESAPEVFDIPPELGALTHFNLLLAGVSTNGITVQVGVGIKTADRDLPIQQAIVVLDRETGEPVWASDGFDESVAVMSMAPNGSSYIGNSPVRRIIALCLLELAAAQVIPPVFPLPPGVPPSIVTPQPVGGITKYGAQRRDLLIRDAVCAAEDRARNAAHNRRMCSDAAAADVKQIRQLIRQARSAAPAAIEDGDLTVAEWRRINQQLVKAKSRLSPRKLQGLVPATKALARACSAATH